LCDEIKNEVGPVCITYGGGERGNMGGRNDWEKLGIDRRIILKWSFKMLDKGMDWIDLAQDRVTNLRIP
jgi:hypothetical protein